MRAENSWPWRMGNEAYGSVPAHIAMSDPHIPTAAISTRTSPGPGCPGPSVSLIVTSRTAVVTACFMRDSPFRSPPGPPDVSSLAHRRATGLVRTPGAAPSAAVLRGRRVRPCRPENDTVLDVADPARGAPHHI